MYADKGACDVGQIAGCVSLSFLSAPFNQLASIDGLSALTQLQSLNLSHNALSSLVPLSHMSQLSSLDVSHNRVAELAPLAGCRALRALRIDHNRIVSPAQVLFLAALTGLRCLALQGNPVVAAREALTGSDEAKLATLALLPGLQVWFSCMGLS